MAMKILATSSFTGVPLQPATETRVHAKKTAFRWKGSQEDTLTKAEPGAIPLACNGGNGASSIRPSAKTFTIGEAAISGVNSSSDDDQSVADAPNIAEQRSNVAGKKGILKNCRRCFSEAGDAGCDYGIPEELSTSANADFWHSFRSVDEIFSDRDDIKKRVSFSEKVLKNTYRPGTSILQQKQKAQKRREKRKTKECRHTVSESDIADVAGLTRSFNEFHSVRNTDSDSGLETETTPPVENTKDSNEVFVWQTAIAGGKKKRNKVNRKASAEV